MRLSQTCIVTNESGALAGADITDVAVDCQTNSFAVGGTVTGLAGLGLTLETNGEVLPISSNGNFTFDNELDDGVTYDVSVLIQPTRLSQTCIVTNESGACCRLPNK